MATLREVWDNFIANYRTDGCPNPDCRICIASAKAKKEMEAKIEVLEECGA